MMLWGSKPRHEFDVVADFDLFSTIAVMHYRDILPDPFRVQEFNKSISSLYAGDVRVADLSLMYVRFEEWVSEDQKEQVKSIIKTAYDAKCKENREKLTAALMKAADKMEEE